ncbi:MAG: hypothetical protein O9340_04430 [Cyclobacteriaceae bacterium]|nr:hypothetical protein [Cyclobacteriaceae bacterium]
MQTQLNFQTPESKRQLDVISNGIYFSSASGNIYETDKFSVEPDTKNGNQTASSYKWARWGTNNNYAQQLIDTVNADPAASLLERRIHMHWGKGLYFYKKRVAKDGKEVIEIIPDEQLPAEIDDFMWENDFLNFQQGIIADYEWWHRFGVQYISSNDGKIRNIAWARTKDIRPELRDPKTGRIENYYLSGRWPNPQPGEYRSVPAFDKRNPKSSGLHMHQLVSIDKDYFPQPAWHGINKWLHIAAKIPRWILANIDNSMNIKYHVKIPLGYFLKRHPLEAYKSAEEQNAAIQKDEKETYDKMDRFLTGAENAQKAFYSKVAIDDQGKPIPGWEIITLENKLQDEAWLRAYGTAALAITSGLGLQPSVAGYVLPNGLGSGSGSDLREQFNFSMQVLFEIGRQTTLEPWEIVKRRNGWKDIHLGYKEVVLQSTDQNKSGFATTAEQSPTSDKPNDVMSV